MSFYYDKKLDLNIYYYGADDAPTGFGLGAQIFHDIVKAARASRKKFEDPHFNEFNQPGMKEWKRPTEISKAMFKRAPLFAGPFNQFAIKQGAVGDCWFLSTLAHAATKPILINTLVPQDNFTVGFDTGAFHFRFWCRGKWVDVTVDDRLPCSIDATGKIKEPFFSKPTKDGGFWAPLLEKAYAKVYGSYAAIDFGHPCEAMEDFTGGATMKYDKKQLVGSKFKDTLYEYVRRDSLICIVTTEIPFESRRKSKGTGNPGKENVSVDGIVGKHVYSVLDVADVKNRVDGTKTTIVKCQNPWGNETEWLGDFSDTDPNGTWSKVTQDLRTGNRDDGQFWMNIEDWRKYMNDIGVCVWGASLRGDKNVKIDTYDVFMDHGRFSEPSSGSTLNPNDLAGKQGYYVYLREDPNARYPEAKVRNGLTYNCELRMQLMYKNYTHSGPDTKIPHYGFQMFWSAGETKATKNGMIDLTGKLSYPFFDDKNGKSVLNTYVETFFEREVVYQDKLPAGTVLIVPWMKEWDGQKSPFLIRIIAHGEVQRAP